MINKNRFSNYPIDHQVWDGIAYAYNTCAYAVCKDRSITSAAMLDAVRERDDAVTRVHAAQAQLGDVVLSRDRRAVVQRTDRDDDSRDNMDASGTAADAEKAHGDAAV